MTILEVIHPDPMDIRCKNCGEVIMEIQVRMTGNAGTGLGKRTVTEQGKKLCSSPKAENGKHEIKSII